MQSEWSGPVIPSGARSFELATCLLAVTTVALGGCASRTAVPSPVTPPPALTAPSLADVRPFCVDSAFRESHLEAAAPAGDRVVICARPEASDTSGPSPALSCIELRPDGAYGPAPAIAPIEPHVASIPFRQTSADGHLRFELQGGKRSPHGAVAILRDATSGRVLKRAPVEYDELLDFDGWAGRDVVLRLRVEEGPGCMLTWLDPQKAWPIVANHIDDDAGQRLVDCFDGNVVLVPSEGTWTLVGAGGDSVTFIDEETMAVDTISLGRSSGPEMGRRLASWVDGDGVLVLAYGAPESGTVARIDLKQKKLLGVWVPIVCGPPK
jgi:hypothetical protein